MRTVSALLLVFALAACAPPPRADPAPAAHAGASATSIATVLTGYHWQLADAVDGAGAHVQALLVRPGKPVTLNFDGHGVSVQNACNVMRAGYTLSGHTLQVDNFMSTTMACADPALNALDAAVKHSLSGALTLAIDTSHALPQLTLTSISGQRLTFSGVPTAQTRYGSPGQTLFLEVAPQMIVCTSGAPGAQCLDVRQVHYSAQGLREGPPGPWHALDQPIEGYTHTAGTHNVLRVKRYTIAQPAAHGTHEAYVLDMVIESGTPTPK